MLSPPEVSIRTSVVGLAVMLGTIALVWSWMLGWATLVGFGGLGLFFVRGGGGIARRQTGVAFGVSLFVLAVKYGLLFGGIERPRWVVHGLTLLFVLSVVWSIIESRREGTNAVRAA